MSPLDLLYHVILLGLSGVLVWNTLFLKEPRQQVMSAVVLIPLVLRFLNLK